VASPSTAAVRTLHFGLIGLGGINRAHIRGYQLAEEAARIVAVCDNVETAANERAAELDATPYLDYRALLEDERVDCVDVTLPHSLHYPVVRAALEAGKHVLVEKPVATSLEEAADLLELARRSPGLLVCAPHVLLSPTFRAVHAAVRDGTIGDLLTARARYGWAGPWWGEWFYEPGGGSLFDLGVYNVTSLCALLGPARRVTAMAGVAIPERVVNGRRMRVDADDNAHVLLDFGDARFAVVTTGFTMQRYRSPAIELYGREGTIQLLGDDWAPEGWELWRNDESSWRVFPEADPHWQWTEGLRHLVDCVESGRPTVTRPEHAYHALEIMLAAQAAGRDGVARPIESGFPDPVYDASFAELDAARVAHDRRSHDGL
jgi:predicted dehydrogenase